MFVSQARKSIILHCLGGVKYDLSDEDLTDISRDLDFYSGSDIRDLVKEAAYGPIRDNVKQLATIKKEEVSLVMLFIHTM